MFTHIKLENFKSWQSLDIELAPVTILFGTNSSGKSSILQIILLMLQNFETNSSTFDFGGKTHDYVNLGSFREMVYKHDLTRKVQLTLDTNEFNNTQIGFWASYQNDDIDFDFLNELDTHDYLGDYEGLNIGDKTITYLRPLRQYPQRSYLWSGAIPRKILPDGENSIAALIASTRNDDELLFEVSKWLVKLELVQSLKVTALDREKRFYEILANVGGIETALADIGFGVSQILPIVISLFYVAEGSIILLEQPELHLHPRAQAHLADLMLHVAKERKLQLIVESHSEHLLRRLQRRIAEVENEFASPENVKMYFCDTGDNGSTIQSVEVDEYGQIQNWPDKFFGDITGDLEAMTMAALQRSMNGKD